MAKRGREAMAKRAREVARQQKREDKQERQDSREDPVRLTAADESALLEEFARLNDEFAADLVTQSQFAEEKHRILVALGIETDQDS